MGWVSVGFLLVTGTILAWKRNEVWGSEFGQVLILKLILVGVMLLLTVLHDVMGTRSAIGNQPNPEKRRKLMTWLARVNLFVVLGTIFCGVLLTRF